MILSFAKSFRWTLWGLELLALMIACNSDTPICGPSQGLVTRVIDGDTIEINGNKRIRYLLIDTPEFGGTSSECFGEQAANLNSELVLGKRLFFEYDNQCHDIYGRLLAYAFLADRSIGETLIERGYACTLYIPPNGGNEIQRYQSLMNDARTNNIGMWSLCTPVDCL